MSKILVPSLGESVTEAIISKWLKAEGDSVAVDEPLVELETDKVTLEVNAESAWVISKLTAKEGDTVEVGALLGEISNDVGAKPEAAKPAETKTESKEDAASFDASEALSPAVKKLIDENNLDPDVIKGTGKDGRLTKGDVLEYMEAGTKSAPAPAAAPSAPQAPRELKEREERVRMSKLRQTIASRLKEAQNTAAMLTTFNEVDMKAAMDMRSAYKDAFEKKHGVRLGFMSIFVKAATLALKEFPGVNAEIDGTDVIYKNYYDIGVAVSTPQGLVVPVLRDADQMSFADIEKSIGDYAGKAKDGKLSMAEMTGGTFTITNGGVFGSLMSTPILNAPQSGILGMHTIQNRPMVMKDGSIEARPMMYIALSYDHRIVDGREAVSFLVRMKQAIEDPQRLLIDV